MANLMRASKLFDVAGQVILITGASSGLGEHFAKMLSNAGAVVVLTARREHLLQGLVTSIVAAGGAAFAVKMDVMNRDSVREGIAATLRKYGRIDTLISNAGVLVGDISAQQHTEDMWESVIGTNLSGSWRVAVEVVNQWMLQNGGNIVMVGSILADRQREGMIAYLASKAGLHQLTKALALEWASKGIRVNAIAPGFTLTEMLAKVFLTEGSSPAKQELSELGKKFAQGIPMKSFVELQDLDGPMMLLCSGASKKMNGSIVFVDGGHRVSSL